LPFHIASLREAVINLKVLKQAMPAELLEVHPSSTNPLVSNLKGRLVRGNRITQVALNSTLRIDGVRFEKRVGLAFFAQLLTGFLQQLAGGTEATHGIDD